jgi:hypothetical protein
VTEASAALRARLVAQAGNRCGYCRAHQHYVYEPLHLEHIVPRARGGRTEETNLWLACSLCNRYKSDQTHGRDPVTGRRVRLFNPRRQQWSRHFRWSAEGSEVIGQTVCGRATVTALQMNNDLAILVRLQWITVGWHPPQD